MKRLNIARFALACLFPILATAETIAHMGVATLALSSEERKAVTLPEGIGLKVDALTPGAPAEAVLELDDILQKLDDQWLVMPEQLAVLVRMRKPGQEVVLTVLRGGEAREIKLVLGEREREKQQVAAPGPQVQEMAAGAENLPEEMQVRRVILHQMMQAGNMPAQVGGGNQFQVQMVGGFGGNAAISRNVRFSENGLNVRFEEKDGKASVSATRGDAVEFEGSVNTPEERAKVPAALRQTLIDKNLIPKDPDAAP